LPTEWRWRYEFIGEGKIFRSEGPSLTM